MGPPDSTTKHNQSSDRNSILIKGEPTLTKGTIPRICRVMLMKKIYYFGFQLYSVIYITDDTMFDSNSNITRGKKKIS